MGTAHEASLVVGLIDDVSPKAKTVAQAMADMAARTKALAEQLGGVNVPPRVFENLKKFAGSKADIDAVAAAWKKLADDQKLSANAIEWTKAQNAAVKDWARNAEAAMRSVGSARAKEQAQLREMAAEQVRLEAQQAAEHRRVATEQAAQQREQAAEQRRLAAQVAAEQREQAAEQRRVATELAAQQREQAAEQRRVATELAAQQREQAAEQRRVATELAAQQREQAAEERRMAAQRMAELREQVAEERRLAQAQAAEHRKAAEERKHWLGGEKSLAATLGAGAAGAEMTHAAEAVIHHAADAEQLRFRIRQLSPGDPSEGDFADKLAGEIVSKYPGLTTGKALDNYIELRANSVGENGKVDQVVARRNAFAAARAQNAALALGFEMTPEDMQNLLKGVEGSGRAGDPKAVEKITDAYIRAKQVFGSAIASSMIRDYVANAKSANFSIGDDQFYLADMVRMSEGNASRLGNEVNQTMSTLAGGAMKKQAGLWLVSHGLARADQIEKTGGGNVRVRGGIKGQAVLETNQGLWATTTLREAIEKSGALSEDKIAARMKLLRDQELKRNPNAQIDERFLRERAEEGLISGDIAKMGVRATVSDNLAHVIGNERLIERDTAAMKNASGAAAGDHLAQNPVAAFAELTHSIENFATVLGSPIMKDAGAVLDSIAHSVSGWSKMLGDWQNAHPDAAKWASGGAIAGLGVGGAALTFGALSGLMNGFGLGASATALDGSAAALTAAAERLGATGSLPKEIAGGAVTAPAAGGGLFGAGIAGVTLAGIGLSAFTAGQILDADHATEPGHRPWTAGRLWSNFTTGQDDAPTTKGINAALDAAVAPKVDTSQIDGVAPHSAAAVDALQPLNGTWAPKVDRSEIAATVAAVEQLLGLLGQVSVVAARMHADAVNASHGLQLIGKAGAGHFGLSGIHGG